MTLPPVFPLIPPARPGLFRRTPPAIFPAILGLLGLGLAARAGADQFGLPPGLWEAVLGATLLLWLFAVLAYGAKVARKPGVVADDLRILPGQSGLAAMAVSVHAAAAVMAPYAPGLAAGLLIAGLALHGVVAAVFVAVLRASPLEARGVTPAWHLMFAGPIVAALGGLALGWTGLAQGLLYATMPVAVVIWGISLLQIVRRIPPAPLRPLLAIHLAPASLFGTVAAGLGQTGMAVGFAVLGSVILLALVGSARWITTSGFSPLWGAFTFPLAAHAGLLLRLDESWRIAGAIVLIAVVLVAVPIAVRVMQDWSKGALAARTNAATA